MNILVLGGSNFIGAHTVRRLSNLGHDVTIFNRGRTEADLPNEVQRLYGDRSQLSKYLDALRAVSPDVVLDTLAMTELDAAAVVEVFRDYVGRLVVLSSCDVYRAYDRLNGFDPGPPDETPLTEGSPLRDKLFPYRENAAPGDMLYDYDKILVERAVTGEPERLPSTVLRLPMVFGPGDYQHRLYAYLERMRRRPQHLVISDKVASWRGPRGYVEDIAEAIALCATSEKALNRTYNVAYAENMTEEEWVRKIIRVIAWQGELVKVPDESLPETIRSTGPAWDLKQNWSVDSSCIRQELGYSEIIPIGEALRQAVQWELANPPQDSRLEEFDHEAEDNLVAQL
jgi:nucleoside-diphosphate-sugar epimerase